jgi:hypothetical protein
MDGTCARSAAACTRSTASAINRRPVSARRRFLRFDLAPVSRSSTIRQTIGLAHDPVGELLHDRGIVGRRHRLQQPRALMGVFNS